MSTIEYANEDGHVHLAYFRKDKQLSFVWRPGLDIQVCPGGYAEPVWDGFPFQPQSWALMFSEFRQRCDEYADEWEGVT